MNRLRWPGAVLFLLALLPAVAAAQERGSITGVVLSAETQEPLIGVQVAIPATGQSALTDERGRFLLTNVERGEVTIRVSFLGYRQVTQRVTVGAAPENITITMSTDPLRLDELVVVGYGEERRRNVAGAVASIRPETVQEVPVTSVNQVLQGRLPGVQVVQNSGTPGAGITVRVRGSSSISAGNEPLYVIDGVPMTQGNYSAFSFGFGGQGIDAVSDINAAEIESIEILKDASAAAIYGSRASNGVVLITTKRGTAARPEINFGAYYGQQRTWRRLDLLNAEQYAMIYDEGLTNRFGAASNFGFDGWVGDPSEGDFFVETVSGVDTNWLNEILRTAPISNMEASVRGGTERARYYVSGSALDQQGMVASMGYSRLNGRVNLDYIPFDRLTLGTNVSLARSVTNRARSDNTIVGPFANALATPPTQPVFNEDGTYFNTLPYLNPVGLNREAEAEERGIRILGNTFASVQLFPGVSLRGSVGLDQLTMRSRSYDSPTFGFWASSGGAAQQGNNFATKLTYEGTLNWSRELGDVHAFSGVFGTSFEDNTEEWNYVRGTDFPTEFFKYITSAANILDGTSTRTDWSMMSYFGRVSHTWNDRLTTTFNVRHDGSSRFGADRRFGTFPAVSMLYRIGDESFMQDQNIVSNLALRWSYGITGNQPLGNFVSRALFGGGFNYLDRPGIAPTQLGNPDLQWERTAQLNIGTDFAVLNDRLGITFDWYDKQTTDLLIQRPVPSTTGFISIWSNVGGMQNRGFEIATTAHLFQPRRPNALSWTTTLNLSRNRNEVTELYALPGQDPQPINAGFASRVDVGKPLGFFYGYRTDGLFQSEDQICRTEPGETTAQRNARCAAAGLAFQANLTAPGDIRFRDLNGDGVINADDQEMIGNPWPDWEGGITNNLAIGGFDLSAFVQFSLGNDIFNGIRIYMDQFGSFEDNHSTRALRRWTPDNPNTDEPRAVWGDPNQNTRTSDRFIEDGSFWRLKNLVLGYTLPTGFADRLGYRSARIYVQAQNLFTRTDYTGFDPEVNYAGQTTITRGTDFYTLPQARTWTVGFNLGF